MQRIEVATGIWVVDYEAGIGGECYVPPKPKSQPPYDSVGPTETEATTEGISGQPRGWNAVSQAAIAATEAD